MRSRRIFRFAFGTTLSAAIAFGLAWPLAFVTPLLTGKLLTAPKAMSLKKATSVIILLTLSMMGSAWLLVPTLNYPVVHLMLTGLILFLLFYAKAGGTNSVLVVLIAAGVVVVPLIGTVSQSLAVAAAQGLVFDAIVAVSVVFVASALFPDPADSRRSTATRDRSGDGDAGSESPSPVVRSRLALRSVAVLFPLVALFQLYSLSAYTVVIMQALLLSLEPEFGRHLAVGKGLIMANLAGGLLAVAMYQTLVVVPSYPFFILLMLLISLWAAGWIFSDHVLGALLGAGITTLFIILGPTLTGEAEAGADLWTRLVLIMAAVVYVVGMFGLMERWTRGRRLAA